MWPKPRQSDSWPSPFYSDFLGDQDSVRHHPRPLTGRERQKTNQNFGTLVMVQWLRLCTSNAGGTGSIPGQGTRIPHGSAKKQKQNKNKKPHNFFTLKLEKQNVKIDIKILFFTATKDKKEFPALWNNTRRRKKKKSDIQELRGPSDPNPDTRRLIATQKKSSLSIINRLNIVQLSLLSLFPRHLFQLMDRSLHLYSFLNIIIQNYNSVHSKVNTKDKIPRPIKKKNSQMFKYLKKQ